MDIFSFRKEFLRNYAQKIGWHRYICNKFRRHLLSFTHDLYRVFAFCTAAISLLPRVSRTSETHRQQIYLNIWSLLERYWRNHRGYHPEDQRVDDKCSLSISNSREALPFKSSGEKALEIIWLVITSICVNILSIEESCRCSVDHPWQNTNALTFQGVFKWPSYCVKRIAVRALSVPAGSYCTDQAVSIFSSNSNLQSLHCSHEFTCLCSRSALVWCSSVTVDHTSVKTAEL